MGRALLSVIAALLVSCASETTRPSYPEQSFAGEIISAGRAGDRGFAMALRLRYTNRSDDATRVECTIGVSSSRAVPARRYVTSPRIIEPGRSKTFSTITEIGIVENVTKLEIQSCKGVP